MEHTQLLLMPCAEQFLSRLQLVIVVSVSTASSNSRVCLCTCIGAGVDVSVGVGFFFKKKNSRVSCKYSVRICIRCLYFWLWFGAR